MVQRYVWAAVLLCEIWYTQRMYSSMYIWPKWCVSIAIHSETGQRDARVGRWRRWLLSAAFAHCHRATLQNTCLFPLNLTSTMAAHSIQALSLTLFAVADRYNFTTVSLQFCDIPSKCIAFHRPLLVVLLPLPRSPLSLPMLHRNWICWCSNSSLFGLNIALCFHSVSSSLFLIHLQQEVEGSLYLNPIHFKI